MQQTDDSVLLRQYAENHSGEAFAALVTRHVNLVYSIALRHVGNPHSAEEITQAVFIILAKKATRLHHDKALSSWLFQATRLTATNFVRSEARRHRREQEAYMQSLLEEPGSDVWPGIAPLLDSAVAGLREKDRQAIVLRFYEGRNLREVGQALGANEAAAEKRVNRALEKLRTFFARRGVSSTTAIIAGAISSNSVQAAPVALAKTVSAIAVAKGVVASTSTLTLIKGAMKIMAWTNAKTAIVVGAGVLLAAGTTTVTVKEIRAHETYPWQSRNANSDVLRRVPPQVKIAPAKFPDSMGAGSVSIENGKTMGVSQDAKTILASAYGQSSIRIVVSGNAKLPQDKYDYIANLPSGNEEALQREIKRKFGLVGRRETREMDVLFLKIQSSDAPELKPADPRRLDRNTGSSGRSGTGYYSCKNQTLSGLAWFLEYRYATPVIDQTGLANRFDIDLKWNEADYQHANLENLKQVLLDQLGLELVPSREPIEVLVVEKVK